MAPASEAFEPVNDDRQEILCRFASAVLLPCTFHNGRRSSGRRTPLAALNLLKDQ